MNTILTNSTTSRLSQCRRAAPDSKNVRSAADLCEKGIIYKVYLIALHVLNLSFERYFMLSLFAPSRSMYHKVVRCIYVGLRAMYGLFITVGDWDNQPMVCQNIFLPRHFTFRTSMSASLLHREGKGGEILHISCPAEPAGAYSANIEVRLPM